MSNSKFVPTWKEVDKAILDTKCKIALLNAQLIGEIEKREDGHHESCTLDEDDVLRGHGQKLIEKVSRLILELESLKLNLKKINDLRTGYANNAYISGGRTVPPIQEEGATEKTSKAESVQSVTKRENSDTQRSSKKDSGIDVDESLSRPASNLSQRSLSTASDHEPCESDDPINRRLSTRTEQLLTVQAQKAFSRRDVNSKDKSSTL